MNQKSEDRTQKTDYEGRRKKEEGRLFVVYRLSSIIFRAFILFSVLCFLSSAYGCDAFVRKFTRKPKKENIAPIEMVLAPEEYKPTMDKEQAFRQYFLFWKSWQDELINALSANTSHKRQLDCLEEAVQNIHNLREMLDQDKQKKLDIYIAQLEGLRSSIENDLYGTNSVNNLQSAERIKRGILRDFSYIDIKNNLL